DEFQVPDWSAVAGQEGAIAFLRRLLAGANRHHAYLFVGPEGVGKTMAARAFAAGLLCRSQPGAARPCGACPSCRRLPSGTHPDFLSVAPEGKSIGIDAVRFLQRWAAVRPALSGARVILLEPAEAVTPVAQNALLKTLEEPPGDTVLIMVSHVPAGLLATVTSRCQTVPFHALPEGDVDRLLRERRPEYGPFTKLIAA